MSAANALPCTHRVAFRAIACARFQAGVTTDHTSAQAMNPMRAQPPSPGLVSLPVASGRRGRRATPHPKRSTRVAASAQPGLNHTQPGLNPTSSACPRDRSSLPPAPLVKEDDLLTAGSAELPLSDGPDYTSPINRQFHQHHSTAPGGPPSLSPATRRRRSLQGIGPASVAKFPVGPSGPSIARRTNPRPPSAMLHGPLCLWRSIAAQPGRSAPSPTCGASAPAPCAARRRVGQDTRRAAACRRTAANAARPG